MLNYLYYIRSEIMKFSKKYGFQGIKLIIVILNYLKLKNYKNYAPKKQSIKLVHLVLNCISK